MRWVPIVDKIQNADAKPTRVESNRREWDNKQKSRQGVPLLGSRPFAPLHDCPSLLSLIFLGELPQRAIQCSHRNPEEF